MIRRMSIGLSFTAGLAVCAATTVLLDRPYPALVESGAGEPAQPWGAMPRCREHAVILSWIFEHRPDAASLEFLSWSVPKQVPEDPFLKGPATLVQIVVKNHATTRDSVEYVSFYLRKFEVLGSVNEAQGCPRVAVCA